VIFAHSHSLAANGRRESEFLDRASRLPRERSFYVGFAQKRGPLDRRSPLPWQPRSVIRP
jgi:hypothetical protein